MVSSFDSLCVGTSLLGKAGNTEAGSMLVEQAFPFSSNISLRNVKLEDSQP